MFELELESLKEKNKILEANLLTEQKSHEASLKSDREDYLSKKAELTDLNNQLQQEVNKYTNQISAMMNESLTMKGKLQTQEQMFKQLKEKV